MSIIIIILAITLIALLFAVTNTEEKERDNLTLESGFNILKIDVTNLLVNRFTSDERYANNCGWFARSYLHNWPGLLNGDQQLPVPSRVTFTTWKHWNKNNQLLPSGLIGSAALRCSSIVPL